jgi:hypothetical protein
MKELFIQAWEDAYFRQSFALMVGVVLGFAILFVLDKFRGWKQKWKQNWWRP